MVDIVTGVLNDILKVDTVEEAFGSFLLNRPQPDSDKLTFFQLELNKAFRSMNNPGSAEHMEVAIHNYLSVTFDCTLGRLKMLFKLLENAVRSGSIAPRVLCESMITFDKLQYKFHDFWIESFDLIYRLIELVEYKGVREVMKGCCEKAKTLPCCMNSAVLPLIDALVHLASKIMDRRSCLLPGYLLVNELQKSYSEPPHWRFAELFFDYVESFRECAQMLTVISQTEMRPVVEHSGCPEHLVNPWKLDPNTLRFSIKGTLPYASVLLDKQVGLLRYVLEQHYSRDMVCGILGLTKTHKQYCPALEEQLIELVVQALERTEAEIEENNQNSHGMWLHLSSQLIYFVLFQFASFPNFVMALHSRLQGRELRKGRDQLMWVLLQFISGSIQRNPLANFLPVLKLYELLFPDDEVPLTVPEYNQPQCTRQMAVTCIWIHLMKKAQTENTSLLLQIPAKLSHHHDFLQQLVSPNNNSLTMGNNDYRIALLCNAYSTNQEYFSKPMAALVESIQGSSKSIGLSPPTAPLSMAILDSLTVHSKMSLIHSIVTHVIKLAPAKTGLTLAPALIETYSRLLVYTEIESLGIKGFISQLLPAVYKSQSWGTLYILLEMFSYRMHHIHPHYRVQLLSTLHMLAAVPQANQTQLHLCVESTALRLILGLGSGEVQPELSRFLAEPKSLISSDSEELNRALVWTLARATHVTGTDGSWCQELLNTIQQSTPHTWAPHTLECFPNTIADFFTQHAVARENKQQLKKAVEEEYRKWASINNENDMMSHFGVTGAPPLFLCLLWKMLMGNDLIRPIAYKILERIGARALSVHLRKFCDWLVFEFSNSPGSTHVNKCVDTINDMIWKYNIVTIDRLVLCLALRTQEGNEAQVCAFIIQLVLLKGVEFRNRLQDFVKDNSPDYWNQHNWHEKHLEFHRKYPEKYAPEEQAAVYHPYFGNVCLRFLPVLDIMVHRFLEIPQVTKNLEILLDHLGCLYKFHDRPVTYLYNTLHFYETQMRDRPPLKRRLVGAVLSNIKDILSPPYQMFLNRSNDELWIPDSTYYIQLVKRVVDTLNGTIIMTTDWRFNEFPNASAHILYSTCVELMGLSSGPNAVANGLLDAITEGFVMITPSSEVSQWINAIGLIIAALPCSYYAALQERLVDTIGQLEHYPFDTITPFELFNFDNVHKTLLYNRYAYTLALTHSVWHHAGPSQIAAIPKWVRGTLLACTISENLTVDGPTTSTTNFSKKESVVVNTEAQFLYVCHLVGPFLSRFNMAIVDLTSAFYELLAHVDQQQQHMQHMDAICDFFYHIKYMFVGDSMKKDLESVVRKLKHPLQLRLRFIAHLAIEEVHQNAYMD